MESIEQLAEDLSKDAAARRAAPHPGWLSLQWMALGIGYLVVALAFSGVRADLWEGLQRPWFAAEITALCAIFVTTAVSSALLGFPDLYQRRRTAYAPVWVFALFLLLMFFAWRADYPPAPLPMHSVECSFSILLLSLLPTLAMFHALRQFASTHQRAGSGSAVLFAFSIGALWLRLYEPNDSILHVVEWHYLPIAAFGGAGLWAGRLLLKW